MMNHDSIEQLSGLEALGHFSGIACGRRVTILVGGFRQREAIAATSYFGGRPHLSHIYAAFHPYRYN